MAAWFTRFSARIATWTGHYLAFVLAGVVILAWAISGPFFGFSDTWQLVINTGTTIVTFLMVFLIQNTQNRDARAMHLKLDELIRAIAQADNEVIVAEDRSDAELVRLKQHYEHLTDEQAELEDRLDEHLVGERSEAGVGA